MENEREKLLRWLDCLNHEQAQTLVKWISELTERAGDNAGMPVLRQ